MEEIVASAILDIRDELRKANENLEKIISSVDTTTDDIKKIREVTEQNYYMQYGWMEKPLNGVTHLD